MKRKLIGFVLIIVGILAFLQALGVGYFGLSLGSILLFFLGFALVLDSIDKGLKLFNLPYKVSWVEMGLGLWVAGIGLYDILLNARVINSSNNKVLKAGWPLIFVAIGVSLITSKRNKKSNYPMVQDGDRHQSKIGNTNHGQTPWVLDSDIELEHKIGDFKLNLSTAQITPGEHNITVTAKVGDIVILVPDNVNSMVIAKTKVGDVSVFGDMESGIPSGLKKDHIVPESDVRLNIYISMIIGSIAVQLVPPYRSE